MWKRWYSRFWEQKSVASGPSRRSQALRLEWLEGRIVPSFSSPRTYTAGITPADIVTASLRNNGILDLIAANYNDGSTSNSTVSVYLGNGNGTFRAQHTYNVGANPAGIAVGDINNDGKLDLLVANSGSNNVTVLLGNGDGTFHNGGTIPVGNSPSGIVLADL